MIIENDGTFSEKLMEKFNCSFLSVICFLVMALFASGHLMWYLERERNPQMFPREYSRGVENGLWWSAVTMTTVGSVLLPSTCPIFTGP